jgi:hypothetical protein
MSESAFRFLLQNDTLPYRPSRCYIVADPEVDNRKLWSLELNPPKSAAWVHELELDAARLEGRAEDLL